MQSTGWRSAPDVAYDGDPNTGVAVYDSVPFEGESGWAAIGGTSAGAPQWAGLIALANQGRALKGLGTLSNAQETMYTLPATDFHDITSGNDGGYSAGPGYDGVTGLGSPLANLVIQNLVGGVPPGSAPPVSSNTGITLQTANVRATTQGLPAIAALADNNGIADVRILFTPSHDGIPAAVDLAGAPIASRSEQVSSPIEMPTSISGQTGSQKDDAAEVVEDSFDSLLPPTDSDVTFFGGDPTFSSLSYAGDIALVIRKQ